MLLRLRVKNFLLIDDAELEFSPHLNVLTGETGTGKSLLLGALGLALGARGSAAWIGPAGDLVLVEATFRGDRPLGRILASMGILTQGREVVLSRQVRAGGGSRCFINGQQVLQRNLKRLGAQLVEIHGQRQEERFRQPEVQRDLLDLFGGLGELRREVRTRFLAAREAAQRLDRHEAQLAELARDEEYLRFQLREIEEIAPRPGELEQIRAEVRRLEASARRAEWLAQAEHAMNAPEGGALEALETLDAHFPDQAGPAAGGTAQETGPGDEDAWRDLREALRELLQGARAFQRRLRKQRREDAEGMEALPELQQRAGRLEQLQRKHRQPLAEILAGAERMRASLDELAQGEQARARLAEARAEAEGALGEAADRLSEARRDAAGDLVRRVGRELRELGMSGVELNVAFGELAAAAREDRVLQAGSRRVGPSGAERVTLEARTNPGADLRPLGDIASGGEMARVALALRVVLGQRGRALMTVFDEIDAGLGATAARSVARRLRRVSRHRQVLLVTHLPVIAAAADHHFQVWKERTGKRARSGLRRLDGQERVGEVARMLGGSAEDPTAREHAAALIAREG